MRYRFAHFELDTETFTLRASGRTVSLPRKSVELLALLVARGGCVVGKRELVDALWPEGFVEEANLTQHVYLLRRALREHGLADPIETLARRGYCFHPPANAAKPQPVDIRRLAGALAASFVLLLVSGASTGRSSPQLSPEVQRAYSLGRYFWNLRSHSGMLRSIRYFRSVIASAPHSALGYAGLADAYTELVDLEGPCAQCAGWQRTAEAAAMRALTVDPGSAEAHTSYGMVRRVFDRDDATAVREFHTALQIDPRNAIASQWYGNLLIAQGNTAEGIRLLETASQEQPVSTATYAWLARAYYYERRFDRAQRYARQTLALDPNRLETIVLLGFIEQARGDYGAARRQFQTAARMGITTADAQALFAATEVSTGHRAAALRMLHRLARQKRLDLYASRDLVIALAIAGDKRTARVRLAEIHYGTRLDRQLILQDPHIRDLDAS